MNAQEQNKRPSSDAGDAGIESKTGDMSTEKSTTDTVKETLDTAKQKASSALSQAQRTVSGVVSDAVSEAKSTATDVAGQAAQEAQVVVDEQKVRAADSIESVASALRQTGAQLEAQDQGAIAQYTDAAAEQLERFSDFLKNRNASELLQEVDRFARRQPELFVAGALAGGFLLGRFLKSSSERNMGYRQNQSGPSRDSGYSSYGSMQGGGSWQSGQPMRRAYPGAVESPQPSSGQVTQTYPAGERFVAQQTYESYESEPHLGEEAGSWQKGQPGYADPYATQVKQAEVNENNAPGTAKRDPYQDPGPR